MSLYSEFVIDAELDLASGAQTVAGTQMNVRVEEDEMLLLLAFSGRLTGVTAETLTMGFEVDGAAATALPQLAHTFLTGQLEFPVSIGVCVKLTKGQHVVGLTANPSSADQDIDGGIVHCVFSATRVSNAAVLAHGVDSKVQGIF